MTTTYRGRVLSYAISGGSHEPEITIRCEGLPAGAAVDLTALQSFLKRRAPGQNAWSTPRKEADEPHFRSGLTNGCLDGKTLDAAIYNENTRSADYAAMRDVPRPMHADYTARMKYGSTVNMAGGGPFSGRMTAPLCILGGICLQLLAQRGITIGAHISELGNVSDTAFDPVGLTPEAVLTPGMSDFPVLDPAAGEQMREVIEQARQGGDSVGGIVECAAVGLPAGLGGPMTDGMESAISALVFGIPAVKGIEFGAGFAAARMRGSAHNDSFSISNGSVVTETNRHGGILGGITSGMPLLFRAAIKPTPSIALPQKSVSLSRMEPETLTIQGRHDPCIVPRAVPVVEAACAIAVLDALLDYERSLHGTI